MKRLLKILGVSIFTITPATSVVACGSPASASAPVVPPAEDGVNINDLLIKLQDKISEQFENLINEGKNLFSEGQFPQGNEYFEMLKKLPSTGDSVEIKNDDFISAFGGRIQGLITNDIVPKLLEDSDLRILFNGIENADILNIVNNNTNFFKVPFKWKKEEVEFGIENYDPGSYNITYWYQIRMELNLKISYKDANNKQTEKDANQTYISYFSNTNADIKKVIDAASLEINGKLQNKLIDINICKNEDNSDRKRIEIAENKILDIINNSGLNIVKAIFDGNFTTSITSNDKNIPSYSFYKEANQFYNAFKLSKNEAIRYLQDYFGKTIVKNFDKNLDKWIDNSNLTQDAQKTIRENKEGINSFGKIKIISWTISGLTLKSIELNFINIRTDETRKEWIKSMSKSLGNIFAVDSWLKTPFDIINKDNNLIMYMDKTDFETYVKQNKALAYVSKYFSDKIREKAISELAIEDNTTLRVMLNGSYGDDATLTNSEFVTKIDDNTFKVIKNPQGYYSYIAVNLDGFHFILGGKKYGKNYITFNNWIIKKANSTIWN